MTLTESEYKEFLGTHLKFLYFVGREQNTFGDISFEDFLEMSTETKYQCRRAVIGNLSLIDKYMQHHFDDLSDLDIEILSAFKKQISGKFIIFKCLSKNAIFIDTSDNNFYAVTALGDRFDKFFDEFPVMVSTCLLPFKDKIIYDGFMQLPAIYVGTDLTKTLRSDYKKVKKHNKIRTKI